MVNGSATRSSTHYATTVCLPLGSIDQDGDGPRVANICSHELFVVVFHRRATQGYSLRDVCFARERCGRSIAAVGVPIPRMRHRTSLRRWTGLGIWALRSLLWCDGVIVTIRFLRGETTLFLQPLHCLGRVASTAPVHATLASLSCHHAVDQVLCTEWARIETTLLDGCCTHSLCRRKRPTIATCSLVTNLATRGPVLRARRC
mmetsp:Transcript_14436/g.19459  ORF Transcript_14436/g.19459 Transcript_14436/m.19459 type:complete len:203 (-) Transcript_14436:391-999(-)